MNVKQKIALATFFFLSTIVFFQNCSTRGFDSQVSTTAPSNQIFSDPTGLKASCSINGTTISHASSIVMYQLATPAVGQACVPEQRICNNGALSGSFTNSTCTPAIVPPGGNNPCTLNGVSVSHGGVIAAYATATVAAGTTCVSQQRQCNNGTLSGNYNYNSCSVLPPTPPSTGIDSCPSVTPQYELNASESYARMLTGAYSSRGHIKPNRDVLMTQDSNMIIRLTVNRSDTSNGREPGGFMFADIGPARAGRYVTVSKTKCDYSSSAFWVSGLDMLTNQPVLANSGSSSILINDSRALNPYASQIKITTGVWYINIKNTQCPQGVVCDVVVDWHY